MTITKDNNHCNHYINKFFARFWLPNRGISKAGPKYYCEILRLMAITHDSCNICHNAINYFNNFGKSLLYLSNADSNIDSNAIINTTVKRKDINGDSDDNSDGIVDTNDVIAASLGTDDLEQNKLNCKNDMKIELEMEGVASNANNDSNDPVDSKNNNNQEAYKIIFGNKSRVDKFGTTWKQVLDLCNEFVRHLCLFTFEELQVGFDITSYLIHSSSIVDLLTTFCYIACKRRYDNYYTSKRLSNAIKLFLSYNASAFNKKQMIKQIV